MSNERKPGFKTAEEIADYFSKFDNGFNADNFRTELLSAIKSLHPISAEPQVIESNTGDLICPTCGEHCDFPKSHKEEWVKQSPEPQRVTRDELKDKAKEFITCPTIINEMDDLLNLLADFAFEQMSLSTPAPKVPTDDDIKEMWRMWWSRDIAYYSYLKMPESEQLHCDNVYEEWKKDLITKQEG